jgi:hypothetical protein
VVRAPLYAIACASVVMFECMRIRFTQTAAFNKKKAALWLYRGISQRSQRTALQRHSELNQ